MKRSAGILMHITSLPSKHGIGTLGKSAYEFADFLKSAGQSYWQILPIGPTGYGNSPYTSYSTYAGNSFLIDLDILNEEGLLKKGEYENLNWGNNPEFVDYTEIDKHKLNVLRIAYKRGLKQNLNEFNKFVEENKLWLDDYALYMAIRQYCFVDLSWEKWEDNDLRSHKESAIKKYENKYKDDVNFYKYIQFLFFKQWKALKNYVNSLGIKMFGDIPIYVPVDSSDVWANSESFLLDENFKPTRVSGCPPDAFSPVGQLWGHPLYNWSYMKKNDYEWWMKRIAFLSSLYDVTRIDHFRAFDTLFSIPNDGSEDAAAKGEWVNGPGYHFFEVMKSKVKDVQIIAEDLGKFFPSVKVLLEKTGYPGMKILMLSFDSKDERKVLPFEYKKNCVVYTGTHDNNTVMGWFEKGNKKDIKHAVDYCALTKEEGYNWGMIRSAYSSICDLAIIPTQDILGLDSKYRMNIPSSVGDNWTWRLNPNVNLFEYSKKLSNLCKLYKR